jgi:phage shock protein C
MIMTIRAEVHVMAAHKKLARRPEEGMIAGVAAGIAETYDIDPTLVRLAFVALAIISGGLAILAYLAAALVMPRADEQPGAESLKHSVDDLIARGKELYSETRRVISRPARNGASAPEPAQPADASPSMASTSTEAPTSPRTDV